MEQKKKSEALQASFIATNWQRWVRQLGFDFFSNGSLVEFRPRCFFFSLFVFAPHGWPSFRLHLSVSCRFTPGQEVFGSSVVSCPECYRESSSDGRPASRLSGANPCKTKKKRRSEFKHTARSQRNKPIKKKWSKQDSYGSQWNENFLFGQGRANTQMRPSTLATPPRPPPH